jgi:hypothetical protein
MRGGLRCCRKAVCLCLRGGVCGGTASGSEGLYLVHPESGTCEGMCNLCGVSVILLCVTCVWTPIKTDESLFAASGSSDSVTACGGHDWMGGKVKIGAVGKIKGSGISPEAFFTLLIRLLITARKCLKPQAHANTHDTQHG